MITANNTKLVLPKGFMLAFITEDGDVIQKGIDVEIEIFSNMQKTVVEQLFSQSKPIEA
ncbi:hypothetical protein [Thalassotalea agariperforans]